MKPLMTTPGDHPDNSWERLPSECSGAADVPEERVAGISINLMPQNSLLILPS